MATPALLDRVTLARLPVAALDGLADLRREPGLGVSVLGDRAWVRWPAGSAGVVARLLPMSGVCFFEAHGESWHRLGSALPDFDVPSAAALEGTTLSRAILPARFQASPIVGPSIEPSRLQLLAVADERRATAILCPLGALVRWAESAPTARFEGLAAARAAGEVLIRGARLPEVADARRFWGDRLLVPLGSRVEPDLPEAAILAMLGVADGSIAVVTGEGIEPIPAEAFGPLSRAGVRLAAGGGRP